VTAAQAPEQEDDSRTLAALWFALAADSRYFLSLCATFGALAWGVIGQGGFFRTDLILFTALCWLAAALTPGTLAAVLANRWLLVIAGLFTTAVLLSAIAHGALGAAAYPIAAIVAALALGCVGARFAGTDVQEILERLVVDVCVLLAIACWLGVAFHWTRFADLEAEGWRADAGIGYANVTGVVLVLGMVCAARATARSGALTDQVRTIAVAIGVASAQSRSTVLDVVLCLMLWSLFARPAARALARGVAFGAMAFVGLIPSITHEVAQPFAALASVFGAASLLVLFDYVLPRGVKRLVLVGLGCGGLAIAAVALRARLGDLPSAHARLDFWHQAVRDIVHNSAFGTGPDEIASFARGHINNLFIHNDFLQFADYYGWPGAAALLIAMVIVLTRLQAAFKAGRRDDAALASGVLATITCTAIVDYPLQVPIVTAVAALLVAASLSAQRPAVPDSHRFGTGSDLHGGMPA
jgi:hypothetical protein